MNTYSTLHSYACILKDLGEVPHSDTAERIVPLSEKPSDDELFELEDMRHLSAAGAIDDSELLAWLESRGGVVRECCKECQFGKVCAEKGFCVTQ